MNRTSNDEIERRRRAEDSWAAVGVVAALQLIKHPVLAQVAPTVGAKGMAYPIKPLSIDPRWRLGGRRPYSRSKNSPRHWLAAFHPAHFTSIHPRRLGRAAIGGCLPPT